MNEIELEVGMKTYMNANEISGMMDVVTSVNKNNTQFEIATANTEDGGNATFKYLVEAMNDTKMVSEKNEVMIKKESIGVEFEVMTEKETISIESAKMMTEKESIGVEFEVMTEKENISIESAKITIQKESIGIEIEVMTEKESIGIESAKAMAKNESIGMSKNRSIKWMSLGNYCGNSNVSGASKK